jgi:protein-S-isoprenylcysteine O-methyltransferase Ste14
MAWEPDSMGQRRQRERTINVDASSSLAPRLFILSRRPPFTPLSPHPATPSPGSATIVRDRALDWVERLLVLSLYGWLVFRILRTYFTQGGVVNLLILPSEGLVLFFFLVRRPAQMLSRHPVDWLSALVATCAALLVSPEPGRNLVPAQLVAAFFLTGMMIQVHAKITLGRSIGFVPAHRGLKVSGPYRFIRHPMYAGYILSHLAFLAANPSIWNTGIYAMVIPLQIYRLGAEEQLLSLDPLYGNYRREVRYRLVPGLF